MPSFAQAFEGLHHDRKLTNEELVRAIRFMVAAEYEAVQLYQQLAESTDNVMIQKALHEIANDERVHAGCFLRLLYALNPEEQSYYQAGAKEMEEEFIAGAAPHDLKVVKDDVCKSH